MCEGADLAECVIVTTKDLPFPFFPLPHLLQLYLYIALEMSLPRISVNMTIAPASVTLGVPCLITLVATLSHPTPITIYTQRSVLNRPLAQTVRNFYCVDLSNNNDPVFLETRKCTKRAGGVRRELGGRDDQYFHTLEPEKPYEFIDRFILSYGLNEPLVAGHRYRFGFSEKQTSPCWFDGTREDVLHPPGEREKIDKEWAQGQIILDVGPPLEFDALEGSVSPLRSTHEDLL
jgi:hypothetical protein